MEISFADGLALPNRLEGIAIDNRYVSYRSTYELVDRTLSLSGSAVGSFTSNVAGQH